MNFYNVLISACNEYAFHLITYTKILYATLVGHSVLMPQIPCSGTLILSQSSKMLDF